MINVLHLRDTDRVCGPGKTIIETALAATPGEFCHKIGLFLLDSEPRNVYRDAAAARGIEVIPIAATFRLDPRMLWAIYRAIKDHDIHIVHAHDYKSELLTWALTRIYRIPIMTTVHGWIWNDLRYRTYWRAAQKVLPSFDRVVAVSGQTREAVIACGVPSEKVVLIHNAIVTANYDPSTVEAGTVRRTAGIPPEARVIGCIGRLSREKGQLDLLRAGAQLLATHDDVWFLFAGDGPDRPHVEQLARELGISHRVVLVGHLTDVRPVFRDIDILALTSHTEGFPNVVLEAFCMGRAVLATDVGGVREIVFPEETGVLLKPHDPDAIAAGLRRLLDDPDGAARMVAAGRALVERQFSFRQRVLAEEALCRQMLRSPNGGGLVDPDDEP
jgi:glycosyltransferase involved in cell wall biosynthesis